MKLFSNGFLIVLTASLIISCNPDEPLSLVGSWKATELKEEGQPLEVELDKIKFTFQENQTYTYNSTLKYREAGRYQLRSKYLYTTDTLNQALVEKVVEIVRLTNDTLVIKMEDNEKERLLTLAKEKAVPPE